MEKVNGIKYLYASLDRHPDVRPVVVNPELSVSIRSGERLELR